ncbi:MAG: hypothetical protein A2Z34_02360 [Planctomycetes bacterium RBG_16_59_8]|nr:MAG: hypothetical protein A2Z34_02360 [Planctomycetes bacterium RBG_16_59_8]
MKVQGNLWKVFDLFLISFSAGLFLFAAYRFSDNRKMPILPASSHSEKSWEANHHRCAKAATSDREGATSRRGNSRGKTPPALTLGAKR